MYPHDQLFIAAETETRRERMKAFATPRPTSRIVTRLRAALRRTGSRPASGLDRLPDGRTIGARA